MSSPLNFALQAILVAWLILSHATSQPCFSQARTAAQKPVARKHVASNPIGKSLASSSRSTQPTSNRTSVRHASATRHQATVAPATTHGAHESISVMESAPEHFDVADQPFDASDSVCHTGGCDSCGSSDLCCCLPTGFLFDWSRADVWVGTTGFTVPSNILTTTNNSPGAVEGSFGFQEGFNFGNRLPGLLCGQLGSQLGARFVQAQLDGSAVGTDQRNQAFVTGGLFRRVDLGLQGGLVVDYLHDDWIYKADLLQLRGELSYLLSPCHELGFRFTDSQQIDNTSFRLPNSNTSTNISLTTLNTYSGFYRIRMGEQARGQAELQAGWTEDSGTLLGLTLHTPLQHQVGLATNATYLIPSNDLTPSYASEGWNLSLAIVWTPGRIFGMGRDYYRPLFDVANNGSMISKLE